MKTGGAVPDICKTSDLCKTFDLCRTLNICKVLNIRKIILPVDECSGTYRVSKAREDKASRPVLDAEEVTVLLSTSVKA